MKTFLKKTSILFVVIMCLFSFSNLFAQGEEKSSRKKSKTELFAFGPKISVNITNRWMSKHTNTEFLPGADLGLFFRFSISRIYIQPEVNYVIRNQNHKSSFQMPPFINEYYKSHHFDMPILVGVKAIDLKQFKIRIFFGPEFCVKFKDHISHNDFQLGFQTGVGLDIWRFTFDAGYSFLGNIHPNRTGHNNIFKVGVGFKCS